MRAAQDVADARGLPAVRAAIALAEKIARARATVGSDTFDACRAQYGAAMSAERRATDREALRATVGAPELIVSRRGPRALTARALARAEAREIAAAIRAGRVHRRGA